MDTKVLESLIPASFVRQGQQSMQQTHKQWRAVLSMRRLPEEGWSTISLEGFFSWLASQDTNNGAGNVGAGEREGRVICELVSRRYRGLHHGVGRGGNLTAPQPKAAGSSALVVLANAFLLQIIKQQGATRTQRALLVPSATGMSLTLCLLRLRASRTATRVLWLRCDQASAPKAVRLAGLTLVCVQGRAQGESVVTNMEALHAAVEECGGPEEVLCVMSTTSCFAPRAPDDVLAIARMCKSFAIPHLINNAYGVQSRSMMKRINSAMQYGRVDAFVQSTDKNFMVPVGGAVIASPDKAFVDDIASDYAGRASGGPMIDIVMTLLHLGSAGYARLVDERERLLRLAQTLLAEHFRLLEVKGNDISLAISLQELGLTSEIGSKLFSRAVTGHRVVQVGQKSRQLSDSVLIQDWGTSGAIACSCYVTVAIAIGMTEKELNILLRRLQQTLKKA